MGDYELEDIDPFSLPPMFLRGELMEHLNGVWNDDSVLDEYCDGKIIAYQSDVTFPSLSFSQEAKSRGLEGLIYVPSKLILNRKKWESNGKILLVHDDSSGEGELPYGNADVRFLSMYAEKKGWEKPIICTNFSELPGLLMEKYDLVFISGHGDEMGFGGNKWLSKEDFVKALSKSAGIGYLLISACGMADKWFREFDDDEGGYDDDDLGAAVITETPVRCLTVSGKIVPESPETSLYNVQLVMNMMKRMTFAASIVNVESNHPKGINSVEIPLHYTHIGNPEFKIE